MLPNTILEVTEENTKHFKCVSISMFMQIMQMSLRVSDSGTPIPYPITKFEEKKIKIKSEAIGPGSFNQSTN